MRLGSVRNLCVAMILMFASAVPVTVYGQEIASSAFGKGIRFLAADSTMSCKVQFRIQSLFHATTNLGTPEDVESGFLIRRSRLKFSGFAFDPRVTYKIELGLSNRDISPSSDFDEVKQGSRLILDAVVKYRFADHWTVWMGQTKLPGNRERVISSQQLQMVDRSALNSRLNLDRGTGIQLHGKYKLGKMEIRPIASWSMGEGRNITINNVGGYEYTGRLEVLPFGAFTKKGDYFGADLTREEQPKLSIAATYDFNDGSARQRGNLGNFITDTNGTYVTNDLTTIFADLMFKYKGFSVMSEFATRTAADKVAGGTGSTFATGQAFNIQTGYNFKNNFEVSGRFTQLTPDDATWSSLPEQNEYTLGLSRYFKGHNLKIQSDFSLIEAAGAADPDFRFRFQVEIAI